MTATDLAELGPKNPRDRTLMHVMYGLHTLAPFTAWALALVALVLNYVRNADETDVLYRSHHRWMIRTFWWSLLWLVLTAPLWLLLYLPGAIAYLLVGLWYLYRCLRGWLLFNDDRPAPLQLPEHL